MRVTMLLTAAAISLAVTMTAGGDRQKSGSDLDRLLAPIALYPDQLLAQMLLCAGDPDQVVKLHKWLADHTALKGTALQDEATLAEFGPSFVALAVFPQVVEQMAADRDWTARLGKAFAADRAGVFAAIQRLRASAQKTGALKSTPQQSVETQTTSSGQQVIVIEPANPQVIYVPQYNPQVVYVQSAPSTVVVEKTSSGTDAAVAGLIGFTAGIAIGAAIDNDYYYGPYGMRGGFYMYNDAWDDWYDAREDAREDWMDHREDLAENRGDRAGTRQDQRTERTDQRTERTDTRQGERTERSGTRQETRPEARGHTANTANTANTAKAAKERSGTRSDAFSGYSSGRSESAASSRGQRSRSSSARQGGGGGRRR